MIATYPNYSNQKLRSRLGGYPPVKHVIIDMGHGGVVNGKYYCLMGGKQATHKLSNGKEFTIYEGQVNRQIGMKLAAYFSRWGVSYSFSTGNEFTKDVSLSKRIADVNQYDARTTLLLSLHSDGFPNPKAKGWSIYTSRGQTGSDSIATHIYNRVADQYREQFYMRKDFADGDPDKEADFYVLKNSRCRAVLLESLFFTNLQEALWLMSPTKQAEYIDVIGDAVVQLTDTKFI